MCLSCRTLSSSRDSSTRCVNSGVAGTGVFTVDRYPSAPLSRSSCYGRCHLELMVDCSPSATRAISMSDATEMGQMPAVVQPANRVSHGSRPRPTLGELRPVPCLSTVEADDASEEIWAISRCLMVASDSCARCWLEPTGMPRTRGDAS